MGKLNKIIRVRLANDHVEMIGKKKISAYIRQAVIEKLAMDHPDRFARPL